MENKRNGQENNVDWCAKLRLLIEDWIGCERSTGMKRPNNGAQEGEKFARGEAEDSPDPKPFLNPVANDNATNNNANKHSNVDNYANCCPGVVASPDVDGVLSICLLALYVEQVYNLRIRIVGVYTTTNLYICNGCTTDDARRALWVDHDVLGNVRSVGNHLFEKTATCQRLPGRHALSVNLNECEGQTYAGSFHGGFSTTKKDKYPFGTCHMIAHALLYNRMENLREKNPYHGLFAWMAHADGAWATVERYRNSAQQWRAEYFSWKPNGPAEFFDQDTAESREEKVLEKIAQQNGAATRAEFRTDTNQKPVCGDARRTHKAAAAIDYLFDGYTSDSDRYKQHERVVCALEALFGERLSCKSSATDRTAQYASGRAAFTFPPAASTSPSFSPVQNSGCGASSAPVGTFSARDCNSSAKNLNWGRMHGRQGAKHPFRMDEFCALVTLVQRVCNVSYDLSPSQPSRSVLIQGNVRTPSPLNIDDLHQLCAQERIFSLAFVSHSLLRYTVGLF